MGTFGCYNLSADELQEFLNDGYILHGTFDTADECAANCPPAAASSSSSPGAASASSSSSSGVPTVSTPCCPSPVPTVLFGTFTGTNGVLGGQDCRCWNNVNLVLTYNPSTKQWEGTVTVPSTCDTSQTISFVLLCGNCSPGSNWELRVSVGATQCQDTCNSVTSGFCSPVNAQFTLSSACFTCLQNIGSTLSLTITQ